MILSCTSTVDFDQLENIEFDQSFTASFIFLNLTQNQFLNADNSAEVATLTDVSIIDIFNSEYVQENLVQADFNFDVENTFNRNFDVEFSFLNEDDSITESFTFNVPNNGKLNHLQRFDGLGLLSLKRSRKLRITIYLQPSSDLSILDKDVQMNLNLKSSTNFIFKIN
ncbi:hypothetical protein JBL43_12330 [Aureibaculum sp. A20]|uniref:Lipoprotein n=1 Tax=Aureibaculum flavum TaxID=2795986 RepID=A0ABS0WSV6_9FLAO|nr:hypothetical protein [Aureibaculum flavum]MBJ2175030.1 hypothetical protein [Aureibaculum flavum]